MSITHFDLELARVARLAVIDHLIKKAQALPHVPSCPAKDDKPCTCPSATIAAWLETERHL